ncbi:hypothetical protein [Streptomyces sp. WZ-12]|uniref:hypothetical protein n=1 Tax=Streptomyces sp. WZ-12 TaxID=3030210 RepID=UPI002380CE19|nr:hypothetical protein [Streptomyces sp. WZ-12]
MRIHLTWPNLAATGLTLAVPDITPDALRPLLRRALAHAGPVVSSAADAAGAGPLARLMLPLAVCVVQQALAGPAHTPERAPGGGSPQGAQS